MNFLCPSPGSIRAAKKCISVLIACLWWLLLQHFEHSAGKLFECCLHEDNLLLIRVFVCHNGFICSLLNA